MKTYLSKILIVFLLIGISSCQKEETDAYMEEEALIESKIEELSLQKSGVDYRLVCSIEGIPAGYQVEEYFNFGRCPNYNLFLGRFNAAIVSRIVTPPNNTPVINNAGTGCVDNYCIWITGSNFEDGAYVDFRTTTGSSIISSYRGADRTLTTSASGQQTIRLRLRSQFEKNEITSHGLRMWVVNPVARKWADGRTIRRVGIIEPPCNPICP